MTWMQSTVQLTEARNGDLYRQREWWPRQRLVPDRANPARGSYRDGGGKARGGAWHRGRLSVQLPPWQWLDRRRITAKTRRLLRTGSPPRLSNHFGDNDFGGAAFQNNLERGFIADPDREMLAVAAATPFVSDLNPAGSPRPRQDSSAYLIRTEDGTEFGYQYRTGRRNVAGLTDLGKTLIRGDDQRGMIIDIDHMSARSKADVIDICDKTTGKYPVMAGHVGFVEISKGQKSHEGQLLPGEVERIRLLGGTDWRPFRIKANGTEIITWRTVDRTPIPHTSGEHVQHVCASLRGTPLPKCREDP